MLTMKDNYKLKNDYILANCCKPKQNNTIVGYYSHDNIIKIHISSCPNISNVEESRLISLTWDDVLLSKTKFEPESDYEKLDSMDFAILKHHLDFGIDYSLVIAGKFSINKQEAFDRHKKLKEHKLVERVEATMVQYRKGIADNKWIKHRNHTYYQITSKGENYLNHYLRQISK